MPAKHNRPSRTSLKILGKNWRLYCQPIPDDELVHYGRTEHVEGSIYINSRCTKEQQFDTTIHEAIHVIDAELRLGMSEATVSRLATALAGVVLDNPRVFRVQPGGQRTA